MGMMSPMGNHPLSRCPKSFDQNSPPRHAEIAVPAKEV
jgi:hypothetical protein